MEKRYILPGCKFNTYEVYLFGKYIDTVTHLSNDAEEVKRGLIDHDGYNSSIKVKRVK